MEIYSFLPFCVLRIVKLVFIFVTMSNTLLPRFQEEAQSLFIMERFYKKSLIFSLLLIGIFQFVFAQNGTYSKRYYKQQKVTFNRPNGAYTNQLLLEDFGNGKYYTDRDHATIVDSTYQIKFKKGCKVGGTGAAVIVSTPKLKQYTMEYLIKYDNNFESGLHGQRSGFNLGEGSSGGHCASSKNN